jgi:hypothetical protein
VLDKGIVIDAWVRVSVVGIDLITVEARVVVASIETYLRYSEAVSTASSAARPAVEGAPTETLRWQAYDEMKAENAALRAQLIGQGQRIAVDHAGRGTASRAGRRASPSAGPSAALPRTRRRRSDD